MLKRLLVFLVFMVALVGALGPWAIYAVGLHGVDGKPRLPAKAATPAEQEAAWHQARGIGAPSVPRLNPYTYFPLAMEAGPHKPGLLVASRVASAHLLEHRRYKGMHWWHLSGAALTIWLTRNWTTEQLLSKVVENQRKSAA